MEIPGNSSQGVPVNYDAGSPAQYLLGFNFSTSSLLRIHAITDPLGSPQEQTFDLTVPTYSHPEDPPQKGTSARPETFEARFWSAVVRNGSLWGTHHVNGSRVRQRWYEIALNGWPTSGQNPTLVQSGEIDLGPGIRTTFGSIWVNEDGVAALTFARSSPEEFFAMGRTWRAPTDPLGTMRPAVGIISSTAPVTSGRWGDYSAIVDDPADPGVFWAHHEYTTSSWQTRVGSFDTLVLAGAAFRTDSEGVNPTGYVAQAPVLGGLWEATVDLTGSGNTLAGVAGHLAPAQVFVPAWGEYLLVDVSSPRAFAPPLQAGTGVVSFASTLPLTSSLAGLELATQGFGLGGPGGVNLHNAYDLTVGTE